MNRRIAATTTFALALFAAACTDDTLSSPGNAPQAAVETPPAAAPIPHEPGLPMWVIRDDDSTIYLTGTIHMLPPDLEWRTEKLEAALASSDTLWLELAEIADMEAFRAKSAPLIEKATSNPDGPPLSERLNARERTALNAALERAGLPPEQQRAMDRMKPWYVAQVIGSAPLARSGYVSEAGVDITLANLAKELGKPVKGLETIEHQISVLSGADDDDQLRQLRLILAAPPYALDMGVWLSTRTFEAWAGGHPGPVAALITLAGVGNAGAMDALLKDRNENWAVQIEEMLARDGVDFIAVGAAHLVGPDSVQNRLKLRGIETARY